MGERADQRNLHTQGSAPDRNETSTRNARITHTRAHVFVRDPLQPGNARYHWRVFGGVYLFRKEKFISAILDESI